MSPEDPDLVSRPQLTHGLLPMKSSNTNFCVLGKKHGAYPSDYHEMLANRPPKTSKLSIVYLARSKIPMLFTSVNIIYFRASD